MPPLSFGKYLLHERLAEGGMAVVWRAKLLGPGGFEKTLVVKQIRDELAQRREFVDLFVAEAKLTVALSHANIVPVFELGMVDGVYFLALELVDGPPLATLIADGPLPPPLAAYIVEQVLRGLDYAHRRGVVHRDLSAANVVVSRDGEVKIVDFGIAAPAEARGVAGGSRGYVAPEQEAGALADARSDLYAVGVLLAELLTGQRWDGRRPAPEPLAVIVARATVRDPAARYPDAAAMLAAVVRFLRSATGAPTQVELGALVRRRCPDLPTVPIADDEHDGARTDAGDANAPRTTPTGPRTIPLTPRRRGEAPHAVTFATRIAPAPARRGWALAAVALALVAGAAAVVVARRPHRAAAPGGAVGRLTVDVDPPGAALTLDGQAVAAGTHTLAAGPHTLAARAPGRAVREARVTVPADGAIATRLTLPPPRVALEVTSDPAGAEVLLAGRVLGTTPLALTLPLDLTQPATLKVRKRDYAPVERPLTAAALTGPAEAPRLAVNARLSALPRGELTLNAIPWAHVIIDGEHKPDTPLQHLELTAGPHQVRLICPPTGRELKLTVQVEPGRELRRVADLRGEPRLLE